MTYEQITAKLAAQEAAKLRAKAIVEISEDLKAEVQTRTGCVIVEEIGKVIDVLDEAKNRIGLAPTKTMKRQDMIRLIDKMENRLTVISWLCGRFTPKVGNESLDRRPTSLRGSAGAVHCPMSGRNDWRGLPLVRHTRCPRRSHAHA